MLLPKKIEANCQITIFFCSGIINLLFDGLAYDTSGHFAHCSYFSISARIICFIPLHEKFLPFDWLRAVVFQLNLKYLHVKIANLLRVVV